MMKTKTWIAIIAVLFAVCAVMSVLIFTRKGHVAKVVLDGRVIRTIDLDAVTEEYSFEVRGEGTNVIRVRPGAICVSDADCPDRICVAHGWESSGGAPVVCAPNKLVITISDEDIDGVTF